MRKKRITSRPGLFGMTYHYEDGKYVGKSRPGLFGDREIHYDADGNQVGTSRPGFFAEEVYHDEINDRYISSYKGLTGMIHRTNGQTIGKTTPGFFDTSYSSFDEDDSEYLEDFVDDDSDDCSNSDDEEETTRFESEAQAEKTISKVLLIWGIVLLGLIGFAFIMLPK